MNDIVCYKVCAMFHFQVIYMVDGYLWSPLSLEGLESVVQSPVCTSTSWEKKKKDTNTYDVRVVQKKKIQNTVDHTMKIKLFFSIQIALVSSSLQCHTYTTRG